MAVFSVRRSGEAMMRVSGVRWGNDRPNAFAWLIPVAVRSGSSLFLS